MYELTQPAAIVLRALENGNRVKLGEYEWAMTEDGDIGIVYADKVLVNHDVSNFLKDCKNLPEQELFSLAARNALTQMKVRERIGQREMPNSKSE